ncbi:MAG: hypothetical protein EA393_14835 [Bacteroidetes bacterium]|nr:MAG: hypothetical protein EA393_14835 [Bacteroidota bacterium]
MCAVFSRQPDFLKRNESLMKHSNNTKKEDFTKSLQKRHFVWEKIPSGIFSRQHDGKYPSGYFLIVQGFQPSGPEPDTSCQPVTITVACHDGRRKFFKVNGNDSNRVIPITVFRGFGFSFQMIHVFRPGSKI